MQEAVEMNLERALWKSERSAAAKTRRSLKRMRDFTWETKVWLIKSSGSEMARRMVKKFWYHNFIRRRRLECRAKATNGVLIFAGLRLFLGILLRTEYI